MSELFPRNTDHWLLDDAPHNTVVISSRARLARNLPGIPFAPRANSEQLHFIADKVHDAFQQVDAVKNYNRIDVSEISACDRCFLRESYLISAELEKGGRARNVYLHPEMNSSIMVNEEDHLRMTTLMAGLRLRDVLDRISHIEREIANHLDFAFSSNFGYLTACPTNTGTGLRLSVMMHLPALTMSGQIEEILSNLGGFGLVVRGAYGEHSEHTGDLFQISNEVTLGKSEEEILEILERVANQIVQRELHARERLNSQMRQKLEDVVCRAIGVLAMARRIDSTEAITLLSRARLGIGHEWGVRLSHPELSRLFVDIQPAHLQCRNDAGASPEDRDLARAQLLRERFAATNGENN